MSKHSRGEDYRSTYDAANAVNEVRRQRDKARGQRDALLEAAKALVRDRSTCPTSNGLDLEAWEALREAISKAEGQEGP